MANNVLLSESKAKIENGQFTCIVINEDKVLFQKKGIGVKPIIELYEGDKTAFESTYVLDKVIGKAAAMLLSLAGAKYVYGQIMSKAAIEYLKKRDIEIEYKNYVDAIHNRTGDGVCPLEKSVLNLDSEKEGYEAIKATITKLMSLKV